MKANPDGGVVNDKENAVDPNARVTTKDLPLETDVNPDTDLVCIYLLCFFTQVILNVNSSLTFTLISFCQLQTLAPPCEASLDVGVVNHYTDRIVDADHTDGVIDDDLHVDPNSKEVDNPFHSKVCI